MAKTKVSDRISEKERSKTLLPSTSDSFDMDMVAKYVSGQSIREISEERYLSRGQVELRIMTTLKAISAFMDEKVPEKYYSDPLSVKEYWINTMNQFAIIRMIRNPASQFSAFLKYFKTCSKEEQVRMFNELELFFYANKE